MAKNKIVKPIIIFGYVLIILGVLEILFFYSVHLKGYQPAWGFIIVVALWDVVTGIGVIKLTKWGYYLFKFFLIILFISFPVGTIISYKTFSYMKKNNIKNYFNKKFL